MAAEPGARTSGASLKRRRWVTAVSEVLGVFLLSIVIRRILLRVLAVPGWKSTQAEMVATGETDFLVLARLAAIDQTLRYGALLGVAFAIGWWHRRRRPVSYGLSRGGWSWPALVGVGVVLWGVSKLPSGLLLAADDHLPWLGAGPDHWALFPPSWSAPFLLYMAVSSFLLVPIVEELAFRGYVLNRLRDDYGDAAALGLTTVFFTLVHTQYFKAEILSAGMLVALLIGSLAAGYTVIRTGSLVPCVVAHALANLPPPPGEWSEEAVLAVAVGVVVLAWRPLSRWTADLFQALRAGLPGSGMLIGLATLLGGLGSVLVMPSRVPVIALVLLALGLAGDALDRRGAMGVREAQRS